MITCDHMYDFFKWVLLIFAFLSLDLPLHHMKRFIHITKSILYDRIHIYCE